MTITLIICLCSVTLAAIGGLAWVLMQDRKERTAIMKTLEELIALVTATNTAADSLIVLTSDIKARLDAALAGSLTPEQQAKVDAIFASVEEQKAEIVAAIAANTTPTNPA